MWQCVESKLCHSLLAQADSSDLLVKIVHVNETEKVSLLSDSTKSVRSASWDPTGKYLVTASCDGKLRIYDMEGSTPVLLKIMEGVIGPSESESVLSRIVQDGR